MKEFVEFLDYKLNYFKEELAKSEIAMEKDLSCIVHVNMRLIQISILEMCKDKYLELQKENRDNGLLK